MAALKYVVYGGGPPASCSMASACSRGKIRHRLLADHPRTDHGAEQHDDAVVIMGVTFILAGIAFKLASVPFHFWCPDVFEGRGRRGRRVPLRCLQGSGAGAVGTHRPGVGRAHRQRRSLCLVDQGDRLPRPGPVGLRRRHTTFGNLAAYGQTNLKRLLAYSTIAHAGFMMNGLATMTKDGAGAMLFYLVTYLFMTSAPSPASP